MPFLSMTHGFASFKLILIWMNTPHIINSDFLYDVGWWRILLSKSFLSIMFKFQLRAHVTFIIKK